MRQRRAHPAFAVFWWLTLLFLYLPLAVVVLFSFNAINSAATFAGFSLRWYTSLFGNDAVIHAFYNSMVLALSSSVIALVLGTFLGYGLYRHRGRRMGWLIILIYLPIVMPDVVFGISDMAFFVRLNSTFGILKPGMLTMIISHVTFELPFVALLIYARFVSLDAALFDASKDLYAGPVKRALYFVIPAIKPALVAGFFLAFTLSFDDFVISFFTSGPESATLPIYIWGAIRRGISPDINAIGALMIAAVLIAALVSLIFTLKSRKREGSLN
ncbi:ABC transporter permease [Carnimonas bestiolae]|uniref:ABC transporter permease n=1 Tax=Carnimonas bestiolae TaxID=3402172 RepID=UPI003EDB809B